MTTRPFIIGLTGSIGMGKSTTAAMFAEEGVPVWSADAAVHDLYEMGGTGSKAIATLSPDAVSNNSVNRDVLRKNIATNPSLLPKIEAKIHPLVQQHRDRFINNHPSGIILCDIPLLFETGNPASYDAVITVTTTPQIQHDRVLERPGMTEEHFATILARQLPDAQKRARSDYIIDTSFGLEPVRQAVKNILAEIRGKI